MARGAARRQLSEQPVELASAPEPVAPVPPVATEERIARLAYERFQSRGGEHGHDQDDWLAAEREVLGGPRD
jgi:hypothetical protein